MEVQMPLVIQGLANRFFVYLALFFKGTCLLIISGNLS